MPFEDQEIQKLIDTTLDDQAPNLKEAIEAANLQLDSNKLLKRESLITFFDMRWHFNGVIAL